MDFRNDVIYMRKDNKIYQVDVYTEKVHEKEIDLLKDDPLVMNEFETCLNIVGIPLASRNISRSTKCCRIFIRYELDHALAMTYVMYPIGNWYKRVLMYELLHHKQCGSAPEAVQMES